MTANSKILGREPALWFALLGSVIVLLGTLGFHALTGEQAGLIVGAINAAAAILTALTTRPISPSVFTGFVAALAAVAMSYGLHVTPEQLGMVNFIVLNGLALLTRGQISPTETAVTNA